MRKRFLNEKAVEKARSMIDADRYDRADIKPLADDLPNRPLDSRVPRGSVGDR